MTKARMAQRLPRLDALQFFVDEERVALGEWVPKVVRQALGVYKEERGAVYNDHKVYSLVDNDKYPLLMYFDTMPGSDGTLPQEGWWITQQISGDEYVMWNEGNFEHPPENMWHCGKVPIDEYGYAYHDWQGEKGLPLKLLRVNHPIGRAPPQCAMCPNPGKVWCWHRCCQKHCDELQRRSWRGRDCPAHPQGDRIPRSDRHRTPGKASQQRRAEAKAKAKKAKTESMYAMRSRASGEASSSNVYLQGSEIREHSAEVDAWGHSAEVDAWAHSAEVDVVSGFEQM